MNFYSIACLVVTALYLLLSYAFIGPTESISSTFYGWKNRNYSAMFSIWAFLLFLGCALHILYDYKDLTKILIAFAGFLLFCVTIASTYKEDKVARIHYIVTVLCIISGFAAVTYEDYGERFWWLPVVGYVAGCIILKVAKMPAYTYWIEVLAIIIIFCTLVQAQLLSKFQQINL